MARTSPTEYAEKWSRRLKGATDDVRRGIARVTEAPGEKAARAQDSMKMKLNEAIDNGTWAAQVRSVDLASWQKSATEKGINRIASGVDAALPRQAAMAERLLAAVDASKAEADRIKRGTLEDNINRMTTFVRGMASRKLRRPAGR